MFINYEKVDNEEGLSLLFKDIKDSDIYAIDVESTGLEIPGRDIVIGIAFYFPIPDRSYYVPVAHGMGQFSFDVWEDIEKLSNSTHRKQFWYADRAFENIRNTYLEHNLSWDQYEHLKECMNAYPRQWVAHNAQYDMAALYQERIDIPDRVYDTMVGAHTLFSDWYSCKFDVGNNREWGSKELKWLGKYFKLPNAGTTEEGLFDIIKERLDGLREYERYAFNKPTDSYSADSGYKGFLWVLYPEEITYYAENDTRLTWHLHQKLLDKLAKWDNEETYAVLCDIQRHVLHRMTITGFSLDVNQAKDMIELTKGELSEIEDRAKELAGDDTFNIGSSTQLGEYLERIGVSLPKTKTGRPSTKEDNLRPHYDEVEMIRLALAHRNKQKMVSAYLEAWVENSIDGYVYPEFGLTTKTGRLSSSGRFNNFQNIPRDVISVLSPKKVLRPVDPRKVLIEADYGGQEASVGAWIAEHLLGHKDKTLTNLILDGDMHSYTRDQAELPSILRGHRTPLEHLILRGEDEDELRGMSEEELEKHWLKWCRQQAKTINFGCMYGGSGRAISEQLSISKPVADQIYRDWMKAYPAISGAITRLEEKALKARPAPNGEGMYMYVGYPEIGPIKFYKKYDPYDLWATTSDGGKWQPVKKAAHDTYNHVTQGTSTLITIYSAYRIAVDPEIGHLIDFHATVHDSIIVSCFPEDLDLVCRRMEEIMTDYAVYPPLTVDFEVSPVGEAWGYKRDYAYAA